MSAESVRVNGPLISMSLLLDASWYETYPGANRGGSTFTTGASGYVFSRTYSVVFHIKLHNFWYLCSCETIHFLPSHLAVFRYTGYSYFDRFKNGSTNTTDDHTQEQNGYKDYATGGSTAESGYTSYGTGYTTETGGAPTGTGAAEPETGTYYEQQQEQQQQQEQEPPQPEFTFESSDGRSGEEIMKYIFLF